MGFGGALIWTGLANNLKRAFPDKKIIFLYKKSLWDIVLGKEYNDHLIYQNNPDFYLVVHKLSWKIKKILYKRAEQIVVDIDNPMLHYWDKQNEEQIIFKTGRHAIEIACKPYGLADIELKGKIVLTSHEVQQADALLAENHLEEAKYLCIEPHSKHAFTPNKEWYWDRWQALCDKLNQYIQTNNLELQIVQIGTATDLVLNGVMDLTGKTTFRTSARVLQKALFFVSYVGGLVHLSNAVDTRNIVLMSAWEPKELCWYPGDFVFYTDLECKNCGLKTPCPKGRECMNQISMEEVYRACQTIIESGKTLDNMMR